LFHGFFLDELGCREEKLGIVLSYDHLIYFDGTYRPSRYNNAAAMTRGGYSCQLEVASNDFELAADR
jgi:hypothetical protein